MGLDMISMQEVSQHNTVDDCWLVIHGSVYNLTDFHRSHPGGSKLITDCAGMDATEPFSEVHPKDLPKKLLPDRFLVGPVDKATIKPIHIVKIAHKEINKASLFKIPPLEQVLNTFDFENIAKHVMSEEGWAYYSSGGDDEITLRENHLAFQRIWLKPRVLVDVSKVNLTARFSGILSSIPLYITATALGRLADPEGELAIVRAAAKCNVPYMLPTLSSYSVDEMLDARTSNQPVFSQIYVNSNRKVTYDYIKHLEVNGVKSIFVTVDAPQLGRREKDMRNKFQKQGAHVQNKDEGESKVDRSQGVARAISSFIDPSLDWNGVREIMKRTSMPVYLKGVQTAEDAVLALKCGVKGIVLSNHGGRQLDLCRSAIEILPEVMAALQKEPNYSKANFEVFIDGGIRRGSDIFKAIALGATAVGIGRPVLYALAGYGQKGIEHLITNVFTEELKMCMQLMGATSFENTSPNMIITRNLSDHFAPQPQDNLVKDVYASITPLSPTKKPERSML